MRRCNSWAVIIFVFAFALVGLLFGTLIDLRIRQAHLWTMVNNVEEQLDAAGEAYDACIKLRSEMYRRIDDALRSLEQAEERLEEQYHQIRGDYFWEELEGEQ